jgi:virulence-associated protein VagC
MDLFIFLEVSVRENKCQAVDLPISFNVPQIPEVAPFQYKTYSISLIIIPQPEKLAILKKRSGIGYSLL